MAAAVYSAGLEPWDVTMSDLLQGRASLEAYRGALRAPLHVKCSLPQVHSSRSWAVYDSNLDPLMETGLLQALSL